MMAENLFNWTVNKYIFCMSLLITSRSSRPVLSTLTLELPTRVIDDQERDYFLVSLFSFKIPLRNFSTSSNYSVKCLNRNLDKIRQKSNIYCFTKRSVYLELLWWVIAELNKIMTYFYIKSGYLTLHFWVTENSYKEMYCTGLRQEGARGRVHIFAMHLQGMCISFYVVSSYWICLL